MSWKAQAELYRSGDRSVMDTVVPRLFYEEPQTTLEGNTLWLRSSKVPLLNSEHETIGLLGIYYQDITAKKQNQLALQRSEANLKRVQAVAKIGSWRLDLEHGSLSLERSNETYRLFGIAVGMPMDYKTFLTYVHPDDLDQVNNAWQVALEGKPYHIKHRILVNGNTLWVEERAELEFDETGECLAGAGTIRSRVYLFNQPLPAQQFETLLKQGNSL